MSYTEVFGGQTIYPAQLTFKNISLSADLTLEWPAEIATTNDVVAWIMRVTPTGGGLSIILDDATLASNGVSLLFYNAGASAFTLKNSIGGTIASIDAGTGWDIILIDNSTPAGTWLVIQRGAGTSSAQASLLAGAGLIALGGLLASSVLVSSKAADFSATATDRASMLDWTGGSGAAAINSPSLLGSGWWAIIRNDGSGALTVSPDSGMIDGASSKVFDPNSAAFVFQDGTNFFTVGFGAGSGGASFDYISIDISGASGGDYTLSGAQLNRISYQFTGVLTGDVEVVIPSTVQEYWVTNATTGAFSVSVRTSSQTPPGVTVGQDSSIIGYCNGTIFLQAAGSISTPVAISQGGTGATTATAARANLDAAGTTVDNNFSANQTVVSVDAGAGVGPIVTTYRNSASPAAADVLGGYNFDANNSTPAQKTYASIQATILDKTAASEDATLDFLTVVAGTLAKRGGWGAGFIIGAAPDGGLGTIALASTLAGMVNVVQTDAGAALGPILKLNRNSASPTTSDLIGAVQLIGKDSAGNDTIYGQINGVIFSATDGSEGGQLQIITQLSGGLSSANQVLIQGGNVTLTATDNGALPTPQVAIIRLSASPSANDALGYVNFAGQDSAANQQAYASLTGYIVDPTSTSEDGALSVDTVVAGSNLTSRLMVAQGLFMAGATGGDPGPGGINATALQINGVAIGTGSKCFVGTYTSNTNLSAVIPYDDSIPQKTEGTQIISLNVVTTTATQRVKLSFCGFCTMDASGEVVGAIFQGSASDAIQAAATRLGVNTWPDPLSFEIPTVDVLIGSATTTAFAVRVGPTTSNCRFNGTASARLFGGIAAATLEATVYEP